MRPYRRKETGINGEKAAAAYLEKHGYHILDRNFRVKGGEIDIIASKDSAIIFIEVRTRTGDDFGLPEESISSQKIKKIRDTAGIFLMERDIMECKEIRFDIMSIKIRPPERLYKINHIKDAF